MSLSSRRVFIVRLVSASAAMAAGGVLSACGGGGDGGDGGGNPPAATPVRFDYGVASGDPLADRVVLWTHATGGADPAVVALNWEVALDAGFTQVVSSGQTQAAADAGFTTKVDATGLAPGQTYFFRFRAAACVRPWAAPDAPTLERQREAGGVQLRQFPAASSMPTARRCLPRRYAVHLATTSTNTKPPLRLGRRVALAGCLWPAPSA